MFGLFKGFKKEVDPNKIIDDFVNKDDGHLKNIGEWIDNWNHTSEEKEKDKREFTKQAFTQLMAFMSSSESFRKAQRIIAEEIIKVWVLAAQLGLVLVLIDVFALAIGQGAFAMDTFIKYAMSKFIWIPSSLVFGLYFSGGVYNGIVREIKKSKGEK